MIRRTRLWLKRRRIRRLYVEAERLRTTASRADRRKADRAMGRHRAPEKRGRRSSIR